MAKYKNNMHSLVSIFKALGDLNRLRIVSVLGGGELCVCQITELLKLAPSTVSKHMSVLRQAALVESRKEGRWIYYKLATSENSQPAAQVRELIQKLLQDDQQANSDLNEVKKILKCNPEDLCRKQVQK
ncbi:MAG: ArsR family transcriptional regulator [Candidatus Dadabacteria bacterium]|nr:MAG: ArsR family transcriptional regulator [Candidatus Dadabacteria bacterium]